MKRSEINAEIRWAIDLLEKNNIKLPRFAYWSMDEWREHADEVDEIRNVMAGWDITDYGTGKYDEIGCVLFTVRNGNFREGDKAVPYCEKYLLFKEGQRLPIHYHINKTEDIINRAGGDLAVTLYGKKDDGSVDYDCEIEYLSDGIKCKAKAGEEIIITPGNSIRLTPYINHKFGTKAGTGDLIVGEVSKVNDDLTDNYFAEVTARFADIEEDEPILHPLCNEYDKVLPRK